MYQASIHFSYQHLEPSPIQLISQVLNQWRYNGQVIGREMGITHHQSDSECFFQVRVALPTQVSLLPQHQSEWVSDALAEAADAGVVFESFEILGRDYQAVETSEQSAPFHILYTTHLETCSPLYNGADFNPLPLYMLKQHPELSYALIKWQEDWQACDQLQMNGAVLEEISLAQISEHDSPLSKQGRALCDTIEQVTGVPTYYYLYRLGSEPEIEHHRHCPNCHQPWRLNTPLHDMFHFQCDHCRLISNLSWELQEL